ncbi:unnamed protein product [Rotaria sp. Silwood1]|nr:unnamed protein product [Rotaria sp. Silwood1]
MFKAAILLSYQYNMTIETRYLGWEIDTTTGVVIDTLDTACRDLTASNVVGIVGPSLSREAQLIAPLGDKIGIPVISYSATDSGLSNRTVYPNFYRTVPSDGIAALALTKLFNRFNWTSCVIIYQNDAFGSSGANMIVSIFNTSGISVKQMILFDINTLTIQGDLGPILSNTATRIIILWAQSAYSTMILQSALEDSVVGPYFTWILSSDVSLSSFNQTLQQNLIGMLQIEPATAIYVNELINQTLLNAAANLWQQYEPSTFPGTANITNYALFTFDATWALIQALQAMCSSTINNSSSCLSLNQSSYCFDHRLVQSTALINSMNSINFLGVTGPIQFTANTTDRVNVWPGNSSTQPTDKPILRGVTLRISVIESVPFTIVDYVANGSSNSTLQLSGYIIDLIKALQKSLGFVPTITLANSNKTYDQLVLGVRNGAYDMLVGDVTITSTRRESVDFSKSIFDNSLRIIMKKNPTASVKLFAFMRPFSVGLWLLALAAVCFSGFLFCLIERQENEELRERPLFSQYIMSLWYSFCNIVGCGAGYDACTAPGRLFTGGLYILSVILVATFTANLASFLTIEKTQNSITGIDDIKNGKIPFNRIGIHVGTASEDFYLSEVSKGIRNYYQLKSTQQMYNYLLSDTIDAGFIDSGIGDYITNNVYCNLTLVGQVFDISAFGIVIPQQWIYAQDLDVAILALREASVLDNLQQQWFEMQECPTVTQPENSIGINEICGVFLIFAVICVLTLLFYAWKKREDIKIYLLPLIRRKDIPPKDIPLE